jgi:hypothetical protein
MRLLCMLLVVACGSADAEEAIDDDFQGCPAGISAFGPGLTATGKQHTLKLVSAEPAEPERYRNDWVVELDPADAQIVRAQTFMPVHGHDGRVDPQLTVLEPGKISVERLNFTMRGPWEVRLWLSPDDYVVFNVCVAR